MVFRYVGPFNYWYLQAVPRYSVFNIVRVADGEAERVGSTKAVELADGMEVEIVLAGQIIEVDVAGQAVFTVTSAHGLGARGAGLLTVGKDAAASSGIASRSSPTTPLPGPTKVQIGSPVATVDRDHHLVTS